MLLFDGVCNLCNGTVQWIIRHDPSARIRFASLQSAAARTILAGLDAAELAAGPDFDSVVLIENGRVFTRTTAVLRAAASLPGPWRHARVLLAIPRPVRDLAYRLVARYRYRWFGRTDACMIPSPALAERFLPDPT